MAAESGVGAGGGMPGHWDQAECPQCLAGPGSLSVAMGLHAKPLGSFSLAGQGLKVSANEVPILTCEVCGLKLMGVGTDDHHIAFVPMDAKIINEES